MIVTLLSGCDLLEQSLYTSFPEVEVHVLVPPVATTACDVFFRQVCPSLPSVSRVKQRHLYRHCLEHGKTNLAQAFESLVTSSNTLDASVQVVQLLGQYLDTGAEDYAELSKVVTLFFSNTALDKAVENYGHFSSFVGDVVYMSLFALCGVDTAMSRLESLLHIPKNYVVLVSHEALTLMCVTSKGKVLSGETLSNFCKVPQDGEYLTSVHLYNSAGKEKTMTLRSVACDLIEKSSVLYVATTSAEVLWTLLLPTFLTNNFYNMLRSTACKKYVLVNSADISYADTVNLLENYVPLGSCFTVYLSSTRREIPPRTGYDYGYYNVVDNTPSISLIIFEHFFQKQRRYTRYLFKYEYALHTPYSTAKNDLVFSVWKTFFYNKSVICTSHLSDVDSRYHHSDVYTNFGMWSVKQKKYFDSSVVLTTEEKRTVKEYIESLFDVSVYDKDVSVAVKPLNSAFREDMYAYLLPVLGDYNLKPVMVGRTALEIVKTHVSEQTAYNYILERYKDDSVLYIGSDVDNLPVTEPKHVWVATLDDVYAFLRWGSLVNRSMLPNMIILSGDNSTKRARVLDEMSVSGKVVTVLDQAVQTSRQRVNNIYVFVSKQHYDDVCATVGTKHSRLRVVSCGKNVSRGSLDTLRFGMMKIRGDYATNQTLVMFDTYVQTCDRFVTELSGVFGKFVVPVRRQSTTDKPVSTGRVTVDSDFNVQCVASSSVNSAECSSDALYHCSAFSMQLHAVEPFVNSATTTYHSKASLFGLIRPMASAGVHVKSYVTCY